MRNLFSSRLLLIAIILIISVMILGQSMGFASPKAQAGVSAADSTLNNASTTPQIDWALAGLLLSGALITLFRPKRQKVAQAIE